MRHTCNPETLDAPYYLDPAHMPGECMACGELACPHGEPLHYHHDGCPACCLWDITSDTCQPKPYARFVSQTTQIQENN